MAVRLKDIARDFGVSVVTVSKVLRGNADISEAPRRRVLKRMKELNYHPKYDGAPTCEQSHLHSRVRRSSHLWKNGLIVSDNVNPESVAQLFPYWRNPYGYEYC
jgi:transcriptional regulator with XRE-family HTH domain